MITYRNSDIIRDFIITPLQRIHSLEDTLTRFKIIIPKVLARPVQPMPSQLITAHQKSLAYERFAYQKLMGHRNVN